MSAAPILIERTFDSDVSHVWLAITNKDQMLQWYFEELEEFKPEVGFKTRFNVDCEGKVYTHCWTVTDVVPEQRIAYRWNYAGLAGDSIVTWNLEPKDNRTLLRIQHETVEPFPSDDPNFAREAGIAGWQYFINERLKEFLVSHES